MKTIQLPDSLADALVSIGKELATQDNLGTAWPIWCVMEHKKVYVDYMQSWDNKERQDDEFFDPEDLCHTCRPLYERGELPNDCEDDQCDESTFAYYNMEDMPSFWKGPGMFLTQKACQDHIDSCHYDYTNPRPYAYSAYNNFEMQPIIQALIIAAGMEVPSNHYGGVK